MALAHVAFASPLAAVGLVLVQKLGIGDTLGGHEAEEETSTPQRV